VLNTYWLWLKYELLKGRLTLEDYARFLESMREKMPQDQGYYDPFSRAIDKELKRLEP